TLVPPHGGRWSGADPPALYVFICGGGFFPWRGSPSSPPTPAVEPMQLADHRVACHAAEATGDLAGTQSVRPQLLQQFDPLVIPGHTRFSRSSKMLRGAIPRFDINSRQAKSVWPSRYLLTEFLGGSGSVSGPHPPFAGVRRLTPLSEDLLPYG